MVPRTNYNINKDIKYGHLELVDAPQIIKACRDKWFNQTLTQVNGSVVRLGIVEGEFHWHKHDADDEFFFVLHGKLFIDLEDRTLVLGQNQGVTISKGILHRPRAPKKVVMLMVETSTIEPAGDDYKFNYEITVLYPSEVSLDTSIRDLFLMEGISTRSINVCISEGLKTIGELLKFYSEKRKKFSLIRNCGVKSEEELERICEKYKKYDFSIVKGRPEREIQGDH
jgi:mannose-6-phosphate isomerase-like protein (cupin superfamily)